MITSETYPRECLKLRMVKKKIEIARIWIYFIQNDGHAKPYALVEDLFVHEEFRGKNLGTQMIQAAIAEAHKKGCYKILATSRYEREHVHRLYQKLGFKDWGKEFRLDLEKK